MRPVRMMSLSKIRPYENNVKRHDETQIRNVMQSLTDFGWRQHIVVDSAGVIIIGHCRYEAARRLGMTEAPVEIADDLSEEQAAKLRIIDNKTNESPWDMRALAEELDGLDLEGYELDFNLPDAAEALDLDAEDGPEDKAGGKVCHCPKCGFVFEV